MFIRKKEKDAIKTEIRSLREAVEKLEIKKGNIQCDSDKQISAKQLLDEYLNGKEDEV